MTSDPSDWAGEHLPFLFAAGKSTSFRYRIEYLTGSIKRHVQYNSVLELILNLNCFKDHDTVSYISRDDDGDFMTVTVDQFKVAISESIYSSNNDHLERLYLRLLLTNQYSRFIADSGRFKQFDYSLRRYLSAIKGGIDSHIALDNGRVILFVKYRRLSANHLLAKIIEWNDEHDIHITHINMPTGLANQDYFEEVLQLHLKKSKIRLYNYDPIPEAENDKIVETESEIISAIIRVFNQLLK